MISDAYKCPCCSGEAYNKCCQPFHEGVLPKKAVQLMRSRYSAYAKKLPEYIIKTTHPDNPKYQQDKEKWKKEILSFSTNTQFDKLEILDFEDGVEEAFVTFLASLRQKNKDVSFKEKSQFHKINGAWLYLNGVHL